MLNTGQLTYLEEVLGVSPQHYHVAPVAGVVILAPGLDPAGRELLQKVLQSVGLAHEQVHDTLPAHIQPAHVLAFQGQGEGREGRGAVVWWNLPTIKSMVGMAPEVADLKKRVWSLLQQFKKENP